MQDTDATRFRAVMHGLCRVYGTEPDAALLDAYWLALRSWPLDEFEAGAAHLMRTCKFMPRPADFTELRKHVEPTPGEAWQAVLGRCRLWRIYPRGQHADRIDRAAASAGGYEAIAMADIETALPHMQRRFVQFYEELTDVDQTRAALPDFGARRLGNGGLTRIGEIDDDDT